jgi:hypothetical protein
LAEGLSDFGGGIIVVWVPWWLWQASRAQFLNYTLEFSLQLSNTTENLLG